MESTTQIFLFEGLDILIPGDNSATDVPGGGSRADVPGPAVPAGVADAIVPVLSRRFARGGGRYEARLLDPAGAAAALALGLARVPVRQVIGSFDAEAMRPALTGLALLHWLSGALRCGACGEGLVDAPLAKPGDPAGHVSAEPEYREGGGSRVCPVCGREHFPRISPAVIVLVRQGQEALLARNARFPPDRFGLLAGFVEPGETLEEAAVREVREEAGIEIAKLRYVRSQPWPFPDSLMVAFTADWASGEARADGEEIVELRWC
ncbi:MAG TPA: NAD(+) diphosphatase, partial [Rectinemataceae bacterium]|nr:NAD(+) diphosphatase [Rectinemataceae bacterium]